MQNFHINDFTLTEYQALLVLAKSQYRFIRYDELESHQDKTHRLLWRHDCDLSLHRALRMAQLEHDLNITATYFLNPHCEFYNVLERSQSQLIEKIQNLGHVIGLHFDASYYALTSEQQLDELVLQEATWLQQWFGTKINVFSFHNPSPFTLTCEKNSYGGLINCYSHFFKTQVGYCSDSNGYWRFRRLRDVLEQAEDTNLQVLTHPGWWQDAPMPPRDRVLRATQGRATAVMNEYDNFLQKQGRLNVT